MVRISKLSSANPIRNRVVKKDPKSPATPVQRWAVKSGPKFESFFSKPGYKRLMNMGPKSSATPNQTWTAKNYPKFVGFLSKTNIIDRAVKLKVPKFLSATRDLPSRLPRE